MPANRLAQTSAVDHELSPRRLNIMRLGYAFMGSDWPSSSGQFWCRTCPPSRCSKGSSPAC